MWPLVVIGALLLGGAIVKKRKSAPSEGPGPLEAEPNAGQTAAEAAAAAQDALDQAAQGAASGTPQGAQQANDALIQAAQAAAAAAGTASQAQIDALARQVEELAKQAAANAGVPPPEVKSPTTSPGLPPIPPPATGPTVVVQPAPPPGAPLPPPPTPTAPGGITLPTQLPTTAAEAVQVATDIASQLPIPVTVTPPTAPPPLATEETKPALDPNGTIGLARMMLDRELQANWESALRPQIAVWQKKMGLVDDGSYGPKSALVMADEVGVLPFVRAWPKGSDKRQVLQKYRDDLSTKAATLASKGATEHAKALQASAASEDARTFLAGSNPPPVSGQERLNQLAALTKQVA